MKKVLTIAGSDTCGGAGIQADLKTFAAHGVYGMSVITAVTAQNTQGVIAVQDIKPEIIGKQIDAIFEDIEVDALKIGMVSVSETIETIRDRLIEHNVKRIVLDPVMISKSGYPLLKEDARKALITNLLPLATIVTPNIPEAETITGRPILNLRDVKEAAKIILSLGPACVLLKGGHLEGTATDILFDGKVFSEFKAPRLNTKNTHGTGCTLSASIAANLAKDMEMTRAVEASKKYITMAIEHSLEIGKGVGPTHHFYEIYKKAGMMDE
ncbi:MULTISPECIES: bifunctional hydroxymethylpyrimidine kinase/phosphomethylpyrimidine kinase [Dehalobacter]|jgi:hydroxymethylpyrimidine/phosphomethylpyrimidine kinase|uniref:Hydroxymethylpyrimidine/phosphomethylpyrimidine kinase n=2 Tax=Dehalobacter restrictus TaxID=55583 RepID=A0A857DEW5_9FIRM|nr:MULTISPECIES: bifunctional hydroxymethylpyrimidine kinase/phosphomethylpyrimidine kinase [Dehalobacter]AHF08855.1 phosphomethylpyrimidine kinase [Dehalobacter restrictus DSM 9455]MCG1024124.1 bifunctional hydroxymethylpyrimidine kinase/phosphomethylpyrimidine kinase [Dehalobacter sp.]MDJ0305434.1 bifunctional hydroxymethylpyrimidine kinase/phosphomethylpyrimidine kinase [Dehalobacter sp.]OCZ50029.1 bifunctional hydroxymethylpyrimidine kinase/phosphomethylpyrimidine kinase [Dehalobacter sp. T